MAMAALDTLTRTVRAERDALIDVLTPPARLPAGLGLTAPELEDVLIAIGDLEDRSGPDVRARLGRARRALERELADALAA
jgi:hypothetical protein